MGLGEFRQPKEQELLQKLKEYLELPVKPDLEPDHSPWELPTDWETTLVPDWLSENGQGDWEFYEAVC